MNYAFVKIKKRDGVLTGFFVDVDKGLALIVGGTILQTSTEEKLAKGKCPIITGAKALPFLEKQGLAPKPRKVTSTQKGPAKQPREKRESQNPEAKEHRRILKIQRYTNIIAQNQQQMLEGKVNADTIQRANIFLQKRIAWYSQPGVDPDREPPKEYMR
jgi:hypothetical protein